MLCELASSEVMSEIQKLGVHNDSVKIFEKKSSMTPLKIYDVASPAANILKQEMLSLGGDCAIHKNCVNCKIERSNLILLGTKRQYEKLLPKLKMMNYFGFPEIYSEIKNFLTSERKPLLTKLSDGRTLDYKTARVMGIINVTSDSFFEGSRSTSMKKILQQAEKFIKEGAEILDIGGESSRPGADLVSLDDEIERVKPAVREIRREFKEAVISVDTYKSETARVGIDNGADIINDITALRGDLAMAGLIAKTKVPVILMHMQGSPKTMQNNPTYKDLITDLLTFFDERINSLLDIGVGREKIIIDPGFGFGKTVDHNLEIVRRLHEFSCFSVPVLLGASRKSTITSVLKTRGPAENLEGTLGITAKAFFSGASIVRVHDVLENKRLIKMLEALR